MNKREIRLMEMPCDAVIGNCESVPVRKYVNDPDKIVDTLKAGIPIRVVDIKLDKDYHTWYKIVFNDGTSSGYIKLEYISRIFY